MYGCGSVHGMCTYLCLAVRAGGCGVFRGGWEGGGGGGR